MVSLPEPLTEELIRTQFKKGDILRWEDFHKKKEIKDRFFILLTSCNDGHDVLAVTATKRIELYLPKDAKRKYHEYVHVIKGECDIFEMDTIIDLNWIDCFTIKEISKLLGLCITRRGALPEKIMKLLDQKVITSRLISPEYKRRIIGKTVASDIIQNQAR